VIPEVASDARTTDRTVVALALLSRMIEGAAAFLPVVLIVALPAMWLDASLQLAATQQSLFAFGNVALLLGIAAGIPLQRLVSRAAGRRAAWILALCFLGAGVAGLVWCRTGWQLVGLRLVAGIGIAGQWSAAADIARNSMANLTRWRTNGLLNCALFGGPLLALLAVWSLQGNIPQGSSSALSGLLISTPLLRVFVLPIVVLAMITPGLVRWLVDRSSVTDTCDDDHGQQGHGPHDCSTGQTSADECSSHQAQSSCDSGGCCGPAPAVAVPIRSGIMIAAIGSFAMWGIAVELIHHAAASCDHQPASESISTPVNADMYEGADDPVVSVAGLQTSRPDGLFWTALAAVVGLLVGHALFQKVAPDTGYALLLVLFLLLAIPAATLLRLLPDQPQLFAWLVLPVCVLLGGIYCGCDGFTGESFTDTGRCSKRTRVLAGALALAAGLLAVQSILFSRTQSQWAVMAFQACVLSMGILVIRELRNPMISARSED
jgi:MFS family permease